MTTESLRKSKMLPLCVDLDGTLIANDVTLLSVKLFLKQKLSNIFKVIVWLLCGRAFLKHKLAQNTEINPLKLPYNLSVLNYIKTQHTYRPIYLVTAADVKIAQCVANSLGLFTDVMASNGRTNLRAQNKANALNIRFGQENYIYIGNSFDDLWVWKSSAESWICSNNQYLNKKIVQLNKPIKHFRPNE